jgi:hypothetical protein
MPLGLSLHIGLNQVDPDRYDGWDGTLLACENDARDMAALARSRGFEPTLLLTPDGTADRVTAALDAAAARLGPGDILLFTYSGHGGRLPDAPGGGERGTNGPGGTDDIEPDTYDETLVLRDRQFLDDEVRQAFRGFADDVRIVAVFDCCHSGSAIEVPAGGPERPAARHLPEPVRQRLAARDHAFYQELRRALAARRPAPDDPAGGEGPGALLLAACQDDQVALDGAVNGAFTGALLRVWDDGAFDGGYRAFHRAIRAAMPPTQVPNLHLTGSPAETFLDQRPFTV